MHRNMWLRLIGILTVALLGSVIRPTLLSFAQTNGQELFFPQITVGDAQVSPPDPNTDATAITEVDASVDPYIFITTQQQVVFNTLHLGLNTTKSTLNVKSSNDYVVNVFDQQISPVTRWRMTQWQLAQGKFHPAPLQLSEPLHLTSDQHEVTAGTAPTVVTGHASNQNSDNGQSFVTTYSQLLSDQDMPLPAGHSYHLILTWRAFISI